MHVFLENNIKLGTGVWGRGDVRVDEEDEGEGK
jgi:hypothetical protein